MASALPALPRLNERALKMYEWKRQVTETGLPANLTDVDILQLYVIFSLLFLFSSFMERSEKASTQWPSGASLLPLFIPPSQNITNTPIQRTHSRESRNCLLPARIRQVPRLRLHSSGPHNPRYHQFENGCHDRSYSCHYPHDSYLSCWHSTRRALYLQLWFHHRPSHDRHSQRARKHRRERLSRRRALNQQ